MSRRTVGSSNNNAASSINRPSSTTGGFDDSENLLNIILHILPLGSRSVDGFIQKQIQIDVNFTTIAQLKQFVHLTPSSLVLHSGDVLPDDVVLRSVLINENEEKAKRLQELNHGQQLVDQQGDTNAKNGTAAAKGAKSILDEVKTLPYLVAVSCPTRFYEPPEWTQNPNTVARLLNAGVVAECALAAASRSQWQRGFPEFFSSAQVLWKMMEASSKNSSSYQRRVESTCLSTSTHRLQPVLPFNEYTGELMLPPVLMQGRKHEEYIDEWACDSRAREGFSRDELEAQQQRAMHAQAVSKDLEKIEQMVVRVYGYHVPVGNSSSMSGSSSANHFSINAQQSVNEGNGAPYMSTTSTTSFAKGASGTAAHSLSFASGSSRSNANNNNNMNQQQQQQQQNLRPPMHVAPFTAFFVSRKLLLTTRTAAYGTLTGGTFASEFKFTKRVRAIHGMLYEHHDLHQLRVVEGVAEALADRINHLGISVTQDHVPPGLAATEWCDLMLLEVVNPDHYAPVGEYLLPEVNPFASFQQAKPSSTTSNHNNNNNNSSTNNNNNSSSSRRDASTNNDSQQATIANLPANKNTIFCMTYSSSPTAEWMEQVFGPNGYNVSMSHETVRKLFWGYDLKTTSVGEIMIHSIDEMERTRTILHNCSLLPSSRGAPLFKDIKKTVISSHDASRETLYLFAGIERGRSVEEMTAQREDIIALSTKEVARRDSLAYNVRNEAHASNHLSLVLLYQTFIAPEVAKDHHEHRKYLQQFLGPYEIFTSRSLLSICHRLMLKDADDFNEYGVDFYEHKDLQNGLYCFREGAKMFSTAMIPNLTEYELELRNALQTNVTSVVVALKFSDGTNGAA